MRAPYQILAFPFIKEDEEYQYAIFKRKDLNIWQGIAGGGEDNEDLVATMKREAFEKALIDKEAPFVRLASFCTIPTVNICGLKWGKKIIMIPEFAFGIKVLSRRLTAGAEHSEYLWLDCEDAIKKLEYDSNKSALWELDYRLKNKCLGGTEKNNLIIKRFI